MTTPQPGAGEPLLERTARSTLANMRRSLDGAPPPPYPPLSPQERTEAQEKAKAEPCVFCIGNHALPNGPGCPRIASFELDGDGKVKAAAYWPGRKWAKGRVNFIEDAFESAQEAGDGGE